MAHVPSVSQRPNEGLFLRDSPSSPPPSPAIDPGQSQLPLEHAGQRLKSSSLGHEPKSILQVQVNEPVTQTDKVSVFDSATATAQISSAGASPRTERMSTPRRSHVIQAQLSNDTAPIAYPIDSIFLQDGTINIPDSDGDPAFAAPNIEVPPPTAREVNYYTPFPSGGKTWKRWEEVVGEDVAAHFGLARTSPSGQPWRVNLMALTNYTLMEHRKGHRDKPRTDPYLYGSWAHRFRSTKEFVPHACWLLSDRQGVCHCKYCPKGSGYSRLSSKRPETPPVRTARLPQQSALAPSTLQNHSSNAEVTTVLSSTASRKRIRQPALVRQGIGSNKRVRMGTPTHPLIRTKPPVQTPSSAFMLGLVSVQRRELDLSLAERNECPRAGELVWYQLPKAVVGHRGDKSPSITHWPVMVVQQTFLRETPNQPQSHVSACRVAPLGTSNQFTTSCSDLSPYLWRDTQMLLDTHQQGLKELDPKGLQWLATGCLPALSIFLPPAAPPNASDNTLYTASVPAFILALRICSLARSAHVLMDNYSIGDLDDVPLALLQSIASQTGKTMGSINFFQGAYLGAELFWTGEMMRLALDNKEIESMKLLLPQQLGAQTATNDIQPTYLMRTQLISYEENHKLAMVHGKVYLSFQATAISRIPDEKEPVVFTDGLPPATEAESLLQLAPRTTALRGGFLLPKCPGLPYDRVLVEASKGVIKIPLSQVAGRMYPSRTPVGLSATRIPGCDRSSELGENEQELLRQLSTNAILDGKLADMRAVREEPSRAHLFISIFGTARKQMCLDLDLPLPRTPTAEEVQRAAEEGRAVLLAAASAPPRLPETQLVNLHPSPSKASADATAQGQRTSSPPTYLGGLNKLESSPWTAINDKKQQTPVVSSLDARPSAKPQASAPVPSKRARQSLKPGTSAPEASISALTVPTKPAGPKEPFSTSPSPPASGIANRPSASPKRGEARLVGAVGEVSESQKKPVPIASPSTERANEQAARTPQQSLLSWPTSAAGQPASTVVPPASTRVMSSSQEPVVQKTTVLSNPKTPHLATDSRPLPAQNQLISKSSDDPPGASVPIARPLLRRASSSGSKADSAALPLDSYEKERKAKMSTILLDVPISPSKPTSKVGHPTLMSPQDQSSSTAKELTGQAGTSMATSLPARKYPKPPGKLFGAKQHQSIALQKHLAADLPTEKIKKKTLLHDSPNTTPAISRVVIQHLLPSKPPAPALRFDELAIGTSAPPPQSHAMIMFAAAQSSQPFNTPPPQQPSISSSRLLSLIDQHHSHYSPSRDPRRHPLRKETTTQVPGAAAQEAGRENAELLPGGSEVAPQTLQALQLPPQRRPELQHAPQQGHSHASGESSEIAGHSVQQSEAALVAKQQGPDKHPELHPVWTAKAPVRQFFAWQAQQTDEPLPSQSESFASWPARHHVSSLGSSSKAMSALPDGQQHRRHDAVDVVSETAGQATKRTWSDRHEAQSSHSDGGAASERPEGPKRAKTKKASETASSVAAFSSSAPALSHVSKTPVPIFIPPPPTLGPKAVAATTPTQFFIPPPPVANVEPSPRRKRLKAQSRAKEVSVDSFKKPDAAAAAAAAAAAVDAPPSAMVHTRANRPRPVPKTKAEEAQYQADKVEIRRQMRACRLPYGWRPRLSKNNGGLYFVGPERKVDWVCPSCHRAHYKRHKDPEQSKEKPRDEGSSSAVVERRSDATERMEAAKGGVDKEKVEVEVGVEREEGKVESKEGEVEKERSEVEKRRSEVEFEREEGEIEGEDMDLDD